MSTQQVITGALNRGENVYAMGSLEGITFTVCAVGSDVVILGADFAKVQIIPGCSHHTEQLVSSVSCCGDSGKIAATYGNFIRIFEPASVQNDKKKQIQNGFPYKWVETESVTVRGFVNTVLWNMDGLRMLIVLGDELLLYQHKSVSCFSRAGSAPPVMFCIAEEEQSKNACSWDAVWSVNLAQPPKYIKYSPDGTFFAVAGEEDFMVKVYYQEVLDNDTKDQLNFNFIALRHPAAVRGLEWRRTGRYIPRKCIQSVLMTWCEDNTSRIWKETQPPELTFIHFPGDKGESAKKSRTKIMNRLRGLVAERKRRVDDKDHGIGLRAHQFSSVNDITPTNEHVAQYAHANVQFHLAATINANTDCMLVPTMETNAVQKKPFCVHWLNNKELVFSKHAERLLAEELLAEELPIVQETPSSKDIIDVTLELILRQWSKSTDVLFTIHPVDGSLLVWTVEWMDDLYRQPTVSFTSKFPSVVPITDASSLHPTLNIFIPHEPMYVDVLRQDKKPKVYERLLERHISNNIHVLTNHENGSLNLWHMGMEEKSMLTCIRNFTHISTIMGQVVDESPDEGQSASQQIIGRMDAMEFSIVIRPPDEIVLLSSSDSSGPSSTIDVVSCAGSVHDGDSDSERPVPVLLDFTIPVEDLGVQSATRADGGLRETRTAQSTETSAVASTSKSTSDGTIDISSSSDSVAERPPVKKARREDMDEQYKK